nr:hypothetical protein [Tanacetum cinerariifolium]
MTSIEDVNSFFASHATSNNLISTGLQTMRYLGLYEQPYLEIREERVLRWTVLIDSSLVGWTVLVEIISLKTILVVILLSNANFHDCFKRCSRSDERIFHFDERFFKSIHAKYPTDVALRIRDEDTDGYKERHRLRRPVSFGTYGDERVLGIIDGSFRMCIDYRELSKIDLYSGRHQMRVHEDEIPKTAFRIRYGHYEFTVETSKAENASTEMLRDVRTLIMEEAHAMKYSVRPRVSDVRTLIMEEAHAMKYYVRPRVKDEHQRSSGLLLQPEVTDWKWEKKRLTMDSKSKLPRSSSGCDLEETVARHGVHVSSIPDRDGMYIEVLERDVEVVRNTSRYEACVRNLVVVGILTFCEAEIGESKMIGPELEQETTKVVVIKERLKEAKDHQESVVRFGKKGELATRVDNKISFYLSFVDILDTYRYCRCGLVFYVFRSPFRFASFVKTKGALDLCSLIIFMELVTKYKAKKVCHEEMVKMPLVDLKVLEDGSFKICMDYRKLSEIAIRNHCHQMRVHEEEIPKTDFRTRYGHFEFTIMPFGLTKELVVYTKSKEEHESHLKMNLELLKKENCYVKPNKAEIGESKMIGLEMEKEMTKVVVIKERLKEAKDHQERVIS